jgi:hypothetical protein
MGVIWSALQEMSRAMLADTRPPTKWELLLEALQRNDDSVTSVYVAGKSIPGRYVRSLGSALLHNTTVNTLPLDVNKLNDENSNEPITTDEWASFFHYIATSAALHTVCLAPSDYTADMNMRDPIIFMFTERLLHAVGSNTNVRALSFWPFVVYEMLPMVALLNQTTTLQELSLDISAHVLSDESRLSVVDALANNTQVTDLTLHLGNGSDNVELCVLVLHALRQNSTLQKLALDVYGRVGEYYSVPGLAWSSLLHSKVPLRSLVLSSISFEGDAMEHMLNGLISRDTAIDLELDRCFFGNDAIDSLIRIARDNHKRLISKLTVKEPRCHPLHSEWSKLFAALCPLSRVFPFVQLAIGPRPEFIAALRAMNPSRRVSPCLRHAEIDALVTFVKGAVNLKKLSIHFFDQRGRTMLENALRENGSVENVSGGLTNKYCERNVNLRLLLNQRPMPLTGLSLVPSLFHAAKPAKKMAANMILTGLLSCDHLDARHQG